MRKYKTAPWIITVSGLVLLAALSWQCKKLSEPDKPGDPTPNKSPAAHLANIPVDDTSSTPTGSRPSRSPLVKLYWVGNDEDGFVTAFMYRWTFKVKNSDSVIFRKPWNIVLNYVMRNNKILMVGLDSVTGPKRATEVFRFFSNTDLDPDKLTEGNPSADTALINMFKRLDAGRIVYVHGIPVWESNPDGNLYPVHLSPNSGTFIFESDDLLNRHTFEVKAIDNEGAVSFADSLRFWTPKVEPPFITITKVPNPGANSPYVLPRVTYTWKGIEFNFRGRDRNSRTLEYSWKVDTKDWSAWSGSLIALVTAADMDTPYTGIHLFRCRAKNEFGSITPPDSQPQRYFEAIFPPFATPGAPRRVLVVVSGREYPDNTPRKPNNERVIAFYKGMLDTVFNVIDTTNRPYDVWNTYLDSFPKFTDIARYSTIYAVTDILPIRPWQQVQGRRLAFYMDAGGNVLFNGIPGIPPSLFTGDAQTFFDRLQMDEPELLAVRDECIGAFPNPRLGYPLLERDTSRVDTTSSISCNISAPRGFSENIYYYNSKRNDPSRENQPFGHRYLGSTYKAIYLGPPLYMMKREQAIAALRKAFQDLGEIQP